jgi:hypothetical protein
VEAIIGVAGPETASKTLKEYYQLPESRCATCAECLKWATLDQGWMNADGFCATYRAKGYKAEIDAWR